MELVEIIEIKNTFESEEEIEKYIEEYIETDYHYDYYYSNKVVTIQLFDLIWIISIVL